MVSVQLIRTIVGIIGNVISLVLFLSPLPTMVTICKKKDVENYSPMPYVASLFNCFLWVLYGLPIVHPNSVLVLSINGTGAVIELIYLIIFITYSTGKQRLKVIAMTVATIALVAIFGALVVVFIHTTQKRSMVVGILCIIFCILMYAAPLSVMKMVIKTKSVEYMPLYLSVASFFNGGCWTIYSLLEFDVNILVPNGTGLVFSVAQLILYAVYYKSTQRILEARKQEKGTPLRSISVRGRIGNNNNSNQK